MTSELDDLRTERDNLVIALEAAEAAREDGYQDAADYARLLDQTKTALDEAKTYQFELVRIIGTLREQASTDAKTIARLRRELADKHKGR